MPKEIVMPLLGSSMEEGRIMQWLKEEGDSLEKGEPLLVIESDKASLEAESHYRGTLYKILVEEGESAPVGAPIALFLEPGEQPGAESTALDTVSEPASEKELVLPQAPRQEKSQGQRNIAKEIVMPLLGSSMEEGRIMQWLKEEGDSLEKGEPLLVIESDKASLEAESHYSGTLYKILVEEGESAPVGAPIALFIEPGVQPGATSTEPGVVSEPASEKELVLPQTPGKEKAQGQRIIASPLARTLARDNSVNLKDLKGSGPGGRIVSEDVQDVIAAGAGENEVVSYAGARKAIGDKTQLSKNTAPHYYMTMEINMVAVMSLLEQLSPQRKITLNHILIKAAAMALKETPKLNSTIDGETITFHRAINIGFVVATEEEMQIPVLRGVTEKSLFILAEEAKALAERVRQGRMQVADTQEGTFTISNLGMYGITEFTAVIHQPQTAILAVGAVRANVLKVTLSLDHRVIDGVSGARFLVALKKCLERPLNMII